MNGDRRYTIEQYARLRRNRDHWRLIAFLWAGWSILLTVVIWIMGTT